jgi:Aldehyde dehydrogenase family
MDKPLPNRNLASSKQIHFLICETCFWCASLVSRWNLPQFSNWKVCTLSDDPDIGPVVNAKSLENMEGIVNRTVKEGAELPTGGQRLKNNNNNKCYLTMVIS